MTSAIGEVRRLLDERGVEHEDYAFVVSKTRKRYEVTRIKDCAEQSKARFMSYNDPGKVDVSVRLTPEQAIAAILGNGTLTAEQVRKAIFNSSSYASYDGTKYYADGIGMQAIADELNICAERTCTAIPHGYLIVEGESTHMRCWSCSVCAYGWHVSDYDKPYSYCPNCGRKIIMTK